MSGDLGSGGVPSYSATDSTPIHGSRSDSWHNQETTRDTRRSKIDDDDVGNDISQSGGKENAVNQSPQKQGRESHDNNDERAHGHEHEGKKETTKKSPTGHTTSKTANNNNEQNSFSKCITSQTYGSVGVPPFPTMKSSLAEKRKVPDVGDDKEAMTTKKRKKAPPSKSVGLTGCAVSIIV